MPVKDNVFLTRENNESDDSLRRKIGHAII